MMHPSLHAGQKLNVTNLFMLPFKTASKREWHSLVSKMHTKQKVCVLPRRLQVKVRAENTVQSPKIEPPSPKTLVLRVADQDIEISTGQIGRQANGAIWLTCGETVIYTTACCSTGTAGDGSFLPLTVNYQERFSAAGRTSTGYIKRDGRPRDPDVLVSRLVDRPLRPMFAKGWTNETQVLQWVLSYDDVHDPEPMAITAAGAALLVSDIPFSRAVAGVRVGYLPDVGLVLNPSVDQMSSSKLDLVMGGTSESILMIEGHCELLTEEQLLQAVELGSNAIRDMCIAMEAWAAKVGKKKLPVTASASEAVEEMQARLHKMVGEQLLKAYREPCNKEQRARLQEGARQDALAAVEAELAQDASGRAKSTFERAFKELQSSIMREVVLSAGVRADGRGVTDVRPIWSSAGILPRTHGSALFTRGETQAVCVATLGSANDALKVDDIRVSSEDWQEAASRFYLQYFFPPSSVGEVGRQGSAGRRELGHGMLAERALAPVIPAKEAFPYTMRVESTITESNGSSSMASVCGGCLALMDAGVPLTDMVAGIAMGLILEPDGRYTVLSDILGLEDALGDMDFKVAGTANAVTAFQMDIKVEGITLPVMRVALEQAAAGRRHILETLTRCDPPPRRTLSKHTPVLLRTKIDPNKIGLVVGSGGRTIKEIKEQSGASKIDIADTGDVEVFAPSQAAADACVEMVKLLAEEPQRGQIFRKRKVAALQPYGAFIELGPGRQGLLHISEMEVSGVSGGAPSLSAGQEVDVMVLDAVDGRVRLSRREVMFADNPELKEQVAASPSDESSDSDYVSAGPVRRMPMPPPGFNGGRGGRGGRRMVPSSRSERQ